jgi:hypothetical protein
MPSLQYAFDCGDGAGYSSFSPSGGSSCTANTTGMRSVKGKVRDKNGAVTEYSATVTIADALSLTIVSPGEGESFVIDTPVVLAATFTDAASAS